MGPDCDSTGGSAIDPDGGDPSGEALSIARLHLDCIDPDGEPVTLSGIDLVAVAAAVYAEIGDDLPETCVATVMVSNDTHVREMNARHRGKDAPTNVLSFPALEGTEADGGEYLGDIVVARETVAREAAQSHIPFEHHLTHLIVHGLLHLAGYDHEADDEAEEMEAAEIRILSTLGLPDPYQSNPDQEECTLHVAG